MAYGYGNDEQYKENAVRFAGNTHFISPPTVDEGHPRKEGFFMCLFLFQLPAALEVEGRHIEDVRRHLAADPGFVIIGIVIPPSIIFLKGDLSGVQLCVHGLPDVQPFGKAFRMRNPLQRCGERTERITILNGRVLKCHLEK